MTHLLPRFPGVEVLPDCYLGGHDYVVVDRILYVGIPLFIEMRCVRDWPAWMREIYWAVM